MNSRDRNPEPWAVILAGGEGKRLSELSRRITGDARPKQFCPIIGEASLLEQTRRRVSLSIAGDRTLTVLTRSHQRYYKALVADIAPRNLVVQPQNRGTAPAILYSLLRLFQLDANAHIALFPSDHFVSDDHGFMRHVDLAFDVIRARPELTVLLGIGAVGPETAYGWIEPGERIDVGGAEIFPVLRFWEKPSRAVAEELLERGCLWNSFVIIGSLSRLLSLVLIGLPNLYQSFRKIRPTIGTVFEHETVERLYAGISSTSFSDQVLAGYPLNLAVLPVLGVEWDDLGEPRRVMNVYARTGIRPLWAVA